jgi:hypothetical protein
MKIYLKASLFILLGLFLLSFLGALILTLAIGPHQECAVNASVGPCDTWGVFQSWLIAGFFMSSYIWIVANFIAAPLLLIGRYVRGHTKKFTP